MTKIDEPLQRQMTREPDITHHVIVTFTAAKDDAQVESLGLLPGSPTEAIGQLSAEAIRALAARADVARIRAGARMKPSGA